jgi:hypothetical protein
MQEKLLTKDDLAKGLSVKKCVFCDPSELNIYLSSIILFV